MTPHILLLTGAAGHRLLITVQAIETIEASLSGGCNVYTINGASYLVDDTFDEIIAMLGGLVLTTKVLR